MTADALLGIWLGGSILLTFLWGAFKDRVPKAIRDGEVPLIATWPMVIPIVLITLIAVGVFKLGELFGRLLVGVRP